MAAYEYIRLAIDMGDLTKLNELGSVGWRVVSVVEDDMARFLLLEGKTHD